jgi:predicted permease
MSQMNYQLKQAWASLSKKGDFVATVTTTMGITLGALVCILTLAWVLLSKPLPYPDQDDLYQVNSALINNEGKEMGVSHTYPGLVHLFDNQKQFSTSALVFYSNDVLTSKPSQPTLTTTYITPGWFNLLDAKVAMGRAFAQTEAKDSNNPVAVLSYDTWQNEFGGESNILEQKVDFSGISFRIVGVLADSFVEPQLYDVGINSGVFLPWDYNPSAPRKRQSWGNINNRQFFIGKLDSDMSKTQVEQTLTTLVNGTWQEKVSGAKFFKGWSINMQLLSFKTAILGDSQSTVLLLLAGVIGLVLVACANIANLFMSRTAEQQQQLAIHAAVGASKKHLFRTLFAESGLLMFASVVVALVIANIGFYVLQHYLAERLPRVDELSMSAVTLGSAALIALLLSLFFARLSANMINYRALNTTLSSSGKGTGVQVSKKVRKVLITSQVAVVTTLVFINISLFKDATQTINQPLGYETKDISTLIISVSASDFPPDEKMIPLMTALKKELMTLPQIDSVSQSPSPVRRARVRAQVVEGTEERLVVETLSVDDHYFQMINQTLIEGDFFTAADIKDKNKLLIINDIYAEKLTSQNNDTSVLGIKIKVGKTLFTVSGVVKGVTKPAATEIPMRAYQTASLADAQLLIKFANNQTLSREQAVNALQQLGSQFTLYEMMSVDESRAQLLFTQYITAITSAVLAVITFFLAAIGLYGILSYSTQMRRFELGTRMAIGAKRKDLIGLIIKDNTTAVIIGMVVSVIILLALYLGFAEELVNYMHAQLVMIFVVTLILISMTALFACYWPLRQFINYPAIHSLRGSE